MTFHASDFGLRDRDPAVIETVVFFHYPCKDGLTAGLVAYRNLPEESTLYLPADYSDPAWRDDTRDDPQLAFPPNLWDVLRGRTIYIVDFSFPPSLLVLLADVAKSVWVYDHHKTFREHLGEYFKARSIPYDIEVDGKEDGRVPLDIDLQKGDKTVDYYRIIIGGYPDLRIVFSDKFCGAWLTHNVGFGGKTGIGRSHKYESGDGGITSFVLDEFVNYIDDRDMWKWKAPRSKEFHAALDIAAPKDFFTLGQFVDGNRAEQLAFGTQLVKYFNAKVSELVKRAQLIHMLLPIGPGSFQIPVVNTAEHISEVGHALLEAYPDAPFSATYFVLDKGRKKWSLRGRDTDNFDVSEVAKLFGGGGHAKACGFLQLVDTRDASPRLHFHEFPPISAPAP